MKTNDQTPENPAAFPSGDTAPQAEHEWDRGMTLRDWFAGKASEEDIANYTPATVGDLKIFRDHNGFEWSREWAKYQYATAMLKARSK